MSWKKSNGILISKESLIAPTYARTLQAQDNLERFYEDSKRLYAMPKMMDADEDALRDELALLVYLAELMDSLPSLVADSNATVAMEALSLDFGDDDAVRYEIERLLYF